MRQVWLVCGGARAGVMFIDSSGNVPSAVLGAKPHGFQARRSHRQCALGLVKAHCPPPLAEWKHPAIVVCDTSRRNGRTHAG